MRRNMKIIIGLTAILIILINAILIAYAHDQKNFDECKAKGGVVVSTPGRNWICLKSEVIK